MSGIVITASTGAGSVPTARRRLSVSLALVAAADVVSTALAIYIASLVYYQFVFLQWPPPDLYIPSALSLTSLIFIISFGFGHYVAVQRQRRYQFLWNGLCVVVLAFSVFISFLFLFKDAGGYSRGTLLFQLGGAIFAILCARSLSFSRLQAAVASGTVEARRVILIGNGESRHHIIERLTQKGTSIVGTYEFEADEVAVETSDQRIRTMVEVCRTLRADDVLILPAPNEMARVRNLVDAFSIAPLSVHIIPMGTTEVLATSHIAEVAGIKTLQVLRPPLSLFERTVKRGFDIVAAIVGLLVFAPMLAMAAIAIKLDSSGPVFFRQRRHGYNNEIIKMLKFRSMTTVEDDKDFRQASAGDDRITGVGRFLRATNIDELPQLWNVILGEMSIVGPRPHPLALNKKFEGSLSPFSRRHNVKPGITGWAQVNGYRGETDTLEKMLRRLECDLFYIDNWSFLFDIQIILMTLFSKKAFQNAR